MTEGVVEYVISGSDLVRCFAALDGAVGKLPRGNLTGLLKVGIIRAG